MQRGILGVLLQGGYCCQVMQQQRRHKHVPAVQVDLLGLLRKQNGRCCSNRRRLQTTQLGGRVAR
jgi:hypothetical protein